jgi:hypothetical protein
LRHDSTAEEEPSPGTHDPRDPAAGDRITVRTSYTVIDAEGVSYSSSAVNTGLTMQLQRSTEDEFDRAC